MAPSIATESALSRNLETPLALSKAVIVAVAVLGLLVLYIYWDNLLTRRTQASAQTSCEAFNKAAQLGFDTLKGADQLAADRLQLQRERADLLEARLNTQVACLATEINNLSSKVDHLATRVDDQGAIMTDKFEALGSKMEALDSKIDTAFASLSHLISQLRPGDFVMAPPGAPLSPEATPAMAPSLL